MKRPSPTDLRQRLGSLADLLSKQVALTEVDTAAMRGQWRAVSRYPAGARIDSEERVHFMLSGWACRLRRRDHGKRQIFMFLMPGDVVGSLNHWTLEDRFEVVCLTAVELVEVTPLIAPAYSSPHPAIVQAARMAERSAEAHLFDHIVRLGAMNARQGLAHLLLELQARLALADLMTEDWFPLPIGQRPLGHAMGLSVMHVNATLKQMRADRLIDLKVGWARILDANGLRGLAASGSMEDVADRRLSA